MPEEKGHARHRQDGSRYAYLPAVSRDRARRAASITCCRRSSTDPPRARLSPCCRCPTTRSRHPTSNDSPPTSARRARRDARHEHDHHRHLAGPRRPWPRAVHLGALSKGTLLVRIVLGLTRLLARAPAAARHLVWSLAVVGLLLGTTQPQTTFFETCGRYSCKLPPRIS